LDSQAQHGFAEMKPFSFFVFYPAVKTFNGSSARIPSDIAPFFLSSRPICFFFFLQSLFFFFYPLSFLWVKERSFLLLCADAFLLAVSILLIHRLSSLP